MLIRGDCLEVLSNLPASSVDMVFADLPYGVTSNKWDTPVNLANLWTDMLRVGKTNAAFVFTAVQPFATHLINSQTELFRYDLIWDKTRAGSFANANRSPMRSHETVIVFARRQPVYNPQKTYGNPVTRKNQRGGQASGNTGIKPTFGLVDDSRFPLSILRYKRDDMRGKSGHPTQKPVALLEWLIRTYTNEGDTVLDPTCGSGTTAIAALNTGREYICIEKDATYYDVAARRIASHQIAPKQAHLDFCRSKR